MATEYPEPDQSFPDLFGMPVVISDTVPTGTAIYAPYSSRLKLRFVDPTPQDLATNTLRYVAELES